MRLTAPHVRRTLASWRQKYDCERPRNSLAYATPAEFSRNLGLRGCGRQPALPTSPGRLRRRRNILDQKLESRNSSFSWLRKTQQVKAGTELRQRIQNTPFPEGSEDDRGLGLLNPANDPVFSQLQNFLAGNM